VKQSPLLPVLQPLLPFTDDSTAFLSLSQNSSMEK
jgi:hypothetical protein